MPDDMGENRYCSERVMSGKFETVALYCIRLWSRSHPCKFKLYGNFFDSTNIYASQYDVGVRLGNHKTPLRCCRDVPCGAVESKTAPYLAVGVANVCADWCFRTVCLVCDLWFVATLFRKGPYEIDRPNSALVMHQDVLAGMPKHEIRWVFQASTWKRIIGHTPIKTMFLKTKLVWVYTVCP